MDSPYNYEPLTGPGNGWCQAPKHTTEGNDRLVPAVWVEIFNFPEDDPNHLMNGRYPSCDGCHHDTYTTFMNEMLPELTDEEREIMEKLEDGDDSC